MVANKVGEWCNLDADPRCTRWRKFATELLPYMDNVLQMESRQTVKGWLSPLLLIGYPMGPQIGYIQIQIHL